MHKKPQKKKQSKKSKVANTAGTKNERIKKRAQFAVSKGAEILIPQDDDVNIQRGLYSDELLPRVEELAQQGLNNQQIADALCIGNKTFYEWRHRYPQFAHSLKKYRGVADIMVENALYKNAVGYEYDEVEQERRRVGKDEKGNWLYELVPTKITHRTQGGNATAQIFYLKNRMPTRYRDKVETVLSMAQDISQMAFVIKRREE